MRLNQVTVPCTDYAASVAFYKTLGLVQIVDSPPRYARFECPAGDEGGAPATFSIHHAENPMPRDDLTVYFEVDDLEAEYTRLIGAGLDFISPPTDQSWAWKEARLADPAGTRICLYQAGAMRRFPPWALRRDP